MNFLLTAVPSDKKKTTSKIHDGGFLHGSLGVMGVKGDTGVQGVAAA